jgi:hypothetical protein
MRPAFELSTKRQDRADCNLYACWGFISEVKESTDMRAALVITGLVALLLLAFSPVWYGAIAGDDRVIVDSRAATTE